MENPTFNKNMNSESDFIKTSCICSDGCNCKSDKDKLEDELLDIMFGPITDL